MYYLAVRFYRLLPIFMVLAILTVKALWGHFPVAAAAQTKVVQEVDAFIHMHILHREPLHMHRSIQ